MSKKEKCKEIVSTLRSKGYVIDIEHTRQLKDFWATYDDSMDNMLSRDEYNKAVDAKTYMTNGPTDDISFGKFVWPVGGFTRVKVTKDGSELFGKYNFGNRNFFRAEGIIGALAKSGILKRENITGE